MYNKIVEIFFANQNNNYCFIKDYKTLRCKQEQRSVFFPLVLSAADDDLRQNRKLQRVNYSSREDNDLQLHTWNAHTYIVIIPCTGTPECCNINYTQMEILSLSYKYTFVKVVVQNRLIYRTSYFPLFEASPFSPHCLSTRSQCKQVHIKKT